MPFRPASTVRLHAASLIGLFGWVSGLPIWRMGGAAALSLSAFLTKTGVPLSIGPLFALLASRARKSFSHEIASGGSAAAVPQVCGGAAGTMGIWRCG